MKKLGEFVHIYWLARLLGPVKLISNQPVSFRNLRSRKKRSGAVRKLRNRPTGWLPCLQIDRWSIRYPGVKLNEHLELEASLGKSDSFMLLYFEWLKGNDSYLLHVSFKISPHWVEKTGKSMVV